MSRHREDATAGGTSSTNYTTPNKKLRFRGDLNFHNRIDELFEKSDTHKLSPSGTSSSSSSSLGTGGAGMGQQKQHATTAEQRKDAEEEKDDCSFLDFFKVEMTRGYMLEHDEERYSARRQKIYSFMRIPRDLERFMVYGIMQCADSFLYIHTFLPVRFALAVWGLLTRPIASLLGFRRRTQRLLTPAEICDLLKGAIWIVCTFLMFSVDTNYVYHIIKSQSIIKLYIFYNMLEVGDRLLSAFGQDTIDALFWTATEPKNSKREHFGLVPHIVFALIYVVLHSFLIMFQATTLNVAVNSNNKGLLTIMISNNFVELKGSVFKKFDKNNLFQLTCSDVRERFHLSVLLFIVMIQTMKEFDWSFTQFCVMLPDCFAVLITEILIDWIKHAFITRFNELPEFIYREYTTSLAYDMTQTRQKHAFSDHSDLVARRMGFIPFPLGVVLIKAIYSAVSFNNLAAWILFALAYCFALGLRICLTICALGKACKLMKEHQDEKSNSTPSSMTNVPTLGSSGSGGSMFSTLPHTPRNTHHQQQQQQHHNQQRVDIGTSPTHPASAETFKSHSGLQQDSGKHNSSYTSSSTSNLVKNMTSITSTPLRSTVTQGILASGTGKPLAKLVNDIELDVTHCLELGATALFSNSDVDLDDVCLNEHVLEANPGNSIQLNGGGREEDLARSVPDLTQPHEPSLSDSLKKSATAAKTATAAAVKAQGDVVGSSGGSSVQPSTKRTHKRSESEPGTQKFEESQA